MTDTRDLAAAMRKLRGARSQKEVAARAGFDPSTWSAYEQGERLPRSQNRFEQIARGLGCTHDLLNDVIWECRNERLSQEARSKTAAGTPAAQPEPPPKAVADPLELAIEEPLTAIHQQLKKALLMVAGRLRS